MATVSEVKFMSDNQVGFCPCCGLRRPLGVVNIPGMAGQRCIDCFFGPPGESELSFQGEAIWKERDHSIIGYGQTGDIVASWGPKYFFEPHGNPDRRIELKSSFDGTKLEFPQLHDVRFYQPIVRRYTDCSEDEPL